MKKNNTNYGHTSIATCLSGCIIALLMVLPDIGHAKTPSNTPPNWPQVINIGEKKVTLYDPQIEEYENGYATARSAFSVQKKGDAPEFGALRFTAQVVSSPKNQAVSFTNIEILSVKFPGKEDIRIERLKSELNASLANAQITMERSQFKRNMDSGEDNAQKDAFNNKPPIVYFMEEPAVLVIIDGKPILKGVEGAPTYQNVLNTAYFIVRDPNDKYYYLKGGRWWYRSRALLKGWAPINAPPSTIKRMADKAFSGEASDKDNLAYNLKKPPLVVVSSKPAELIVTEGKPKFVPIEGTNLLYVDNSEDDIILDINTQQYYVLLSGRWYTSKTLTGKGWQFVRPDSLPADFETIPDNSSMASVRANVSGTPEAEDALLTHTVPQTATIDRTSATVSVQYDGAPKFQRIRGTRVAYALNADKSVLLIRSRYYVVDNGVWFESDSAHGPWVVSIEVPPEVQDIPPSEPVYHVRYVYIYDYTPSVVYVGYTPGYYCSYVHYGTVIYGTGYYYRPWYGVYYYPRPMTFGFAVHYNPYSGWWGYPVGVSFGWISFGWFPYQYAYWGPSGYVYGYRHGYYHGHRHGYYSGYRNGYRKGYSDGRIAGTRGISPRSLERRKTSAIAYKNRRHGVRHIGARSSGFRSLRVSNNDKAKAAMRRVSPTQRPTFRNSQSPNVKTGRIVRPGNTPRSRTLENRSRRQPDRRTYKTRTDDRFQHNKRTTSRTRSPSRTIQQRDHQNKSNPQLQRRSQRKPERVTKRANQQRQQRPIQTTPKRRPNASAPTNKPRQPAPKTTYSRKNTYNRRSSDNDDDNKNKKSSHWGGQSQRKRSQPSTSSSRRSNSYRKQPSRSQPSRSQYRRSPSRSPRRSSQDDSRNSRRRNR